jgi:hypothetical protein
MKEEAEIEKGDNIAGRPNGLIENLCYRKKVGPSTML